MKVSSELKFDLLTSLYSLISCLLPSMKIKFRKRNVDSMDKNDDNKQLCSIGDHMRFDCETTMEKGLSIQPPTATTTPSSSLSSCPSPAASNNIVVDCLKSLPTSWSLTGRRGRKGTSSSTTSSTTTTDDVIASDQRLHTKSSTSTSTSTATTVDDQHKMKRVKIETHSDHERLLKKKVHSNEKKNGAFEKEYKCDVCSKVFTTSRALGGHKSSHYKPKKTNDAPIKKETTTSEPKIITMSLDSSTDQTNQKRVMDFDLNMQLPPDDEETS